MEIEIDYTDYLLEWEANYGDDNEAEFVYWEFGEEKIRSYTRMNEAEFNNCVKKFNEYFHAMKTMLKNKQMGSEVDALMSKSFFECELPLFC